MSTPSSLSETWLINHRANMMLLDAIDDEALHLTISKRGGGTPAKQFAHLHFVRLNKVERMAGDLFKQQTKISLANDVIDRQLLVTRLHESAQAIAAILDNAEANDYSVKSFKRGAIALLGYMIAHESHHRGSMILNLKQCGYRIPKDVSFGIWNWNAI